MKNKEYEILLSKFYDLDIEKKKKEIYEELERIKSTPKTISIGGYEKRGVGNSNTSPKFKSFILFPPQVI